MQGQSSTQLSSITSIPFNNARRECIRYYHTKGINMIRLFLIIVAAAILPGMVDMSSHTQKQCEGGYSEANPVRSFIGIQIGEAYALANTTTATQALKGCFSLSGFVEKTIDHFAGYGIDLRGMRRKPLEPYENDKVSVKFFTRKPGTVMKVLTSTLYEYASYVGTDLKVFTASLETKTEIEAPKGKISKPGRGAYMLYNFMDQGKAHCAIGHRLSEPLNAFSGNLSLPMVLDAENDVWGSGSITGLIRVVNSKVQDVIFTLAYFGSNE